MFACLLQRFLSLKRLKKRTDDGRMLVISKGNAGKFTIVSM
jgi:hypothetical protein